MICIYPPDCTDFSDNGLGTLFPISCTVTETLNGEYEVTLEHPIDEAGKWTRLIEGCILRVPVPRGMTPYVKLADQTIVQDTSTRGVWRTVNRTSVRIISGNGKIIGTINGGERIAVSGHEYFATFTHKTDSSKDYVSRYTSYPTDAVPEGFTRTVAIWYHIVAPSGVSGWVPGYSCSNVYKSTSIKTIVHDVVESKQLREQPFRIYRVVPELNKITVYARHIFYDLLDNFIKTYTQGQDDRGAEVVKGIGAACETETDFKFYSDLTSTVDEFSVEHTNPIDAFLGDEGVIATFGGELARDWYDVYIVQRVGEDTNIEIREGKNLKSVSYDVDTTNVITRIVPTGETSKGKTLYLPELYVDSLNAGNYDHPKWTHLAVSDVKESSKLKLNACYEKLREAAQAEFDKGCDQPTVTVTVDFINLFDTEDYKDYAFLQNIFLGDAVRVISKRLSLSVSMRMTQYTYDCLKKQYTSMTLGTVADTLAGNTITAAQLPTGIISGSKLAINSVGTGALQDGAVKSAQIDVAAIETAHIQDAAIATAKIADLSVTSAKIADEAVTNAKIENAAIDNAKIADATIEGAKIKDAAIGSAKIADAAVTRAKIANLAVGEGQIDNLAVTAAKIADAAITNAKIANAAVDTAQIALGAITAALIQQGAVGTAQIADASITEGKIVSLNADVIQSGTLATERLIITGADGLIYEINAQSGTLTTQELTQEKYRQQLSGSVLVARSVTAEQIAAATITANEILSGTITGDKIAAATIEGSNIKAGTITTSHVAANFGEQLDLSSNRGINLRVQAINDDIDELKETSVASVVVQYALSSSASVAPSQGWSANAPPWEDGKFMWQKTVTTYADGSSNESDPTCLSGAKGQDATVLRIDSSRGTVFKNNAVATILSAIIYHGSQRITNITALRAAFGATAYLQWKWQRLNDNTFGTISASDTRLSQDGFCFTLSPEDVDVKVTFLCELITD